jgi:hypothetical protein
MASSTICVAPTDRLALVADHLHGGRPGNAGPLKFPDRRVRVTVEPIDRDHHGGLVADVRLPDGRSLNHKMVRAGLARWYRRYVPDDGELARLEAEARDA